MEILRALGALVEPPGRGTVAVREALGFPTGLDPADHTEVFTFQLPPYASIYLGPEGMLGGEARDRIAGFWRATGSRPPAEPDHLTVLLSAYTSLAEGEAGADGGRETWRRMRHAFFWEHLASWLFPYLARVTEVAPAPYRRWGSLLEEALRSEAGTLGPPSRLPLHLREAPPAADADGTALLDAVLAPARSGVILTRHDLAGAAETLGLGLRLGERRYILKSLFDQAPEETAGWLAREAGRQASLYGSAPVPGLTEHWAARARSTAVRLSDPDTSTSTPTLQEARHA